ncbi:hypothetical protein BBJ28_00004542 [Nothophytophthora sp. Chile5]|nr:hypothetical protein BBJ28_00004542 [Nothophytophthora sp. Chile5]
MTPLSSLAGWSVASTVYGGPATRCFSQRAGSDLFEDEDEHEEEEHDHEYFLELRQERQERRRHDDEALEALEENYMERLQQARSSGDEKAAADEAVAIFETIQDADGRGLSMPVASFLIESLGARKRVKDCMRVLAYSREQGVRPRIHAYSSAVACCYKRQQFAHALRVFEVMRNDGYVPQHVTYSHALSSALKSGQHELVLEIFDDMLQHRVETGIVIYNIILNSCARSADVQSAISVMQAIRQREIRMTQSTFHSLAICAGKTGKWELALDAMSTLQDEGFTPTPTIFNSVFSACAKGRQWTTVVDVYDVMPDDCREKLHGVYLGAVIMGHAKAKSEELKLRGLEIFYEHKARTDPEEQPNFFAHNAALTALLETSQLEKVHALANDMKHEGMTWDTVTYQCVILALIRGGALESAVQMLHRNTKRMNSSTTCYREAIQVYAEKRKNPREACRLTMLMMQANKQLSRLDWHHALEIALQLPERAPYWTFRKWLNVRAKPIVDDIPKHLMLPSHHDVKQASLMQQADPSQKKARHQVNNYQTRQRQLNRRKPQYDEEKLL